MSDHKKQKMEEAEEEDDEFEGASHLLPDRLNHYCDKLGDRLLRAAVEYVISNETTLNPLPLLEEWELYMRLPLERKEIQGLDASEILFQTMFEMNKKLDKE